MQKESEQSGPRQDKAYIISEKQITKMIVKLPTQSVTTIPIKILILRCYGTRVSLLF